MNETAMNKKKQKALNGVDNLSIVMVLITLLTGILFWVPWVAINNATPGSEMVELPTNGFRFIFALLGNGFQSADEIFGDIASFYFHMKDSVTAISIVTTVAMAFVLLGFLFSLLDLFLDKTAFRYLSALMMLFAAIALIVCFVLCIIMLPKFMVKYQCNSYCSPLYFAIIPALVALAGTVFGFIHVAKRI